MFPPLDLHITLGLTHLAAVLAFFLASWIAGLVAWATARRGIGWAGLSVPGAVGAISWQLALIAGQAVQESAPVAASVVAIVTLATITLRVWLGSDQLPQSTVPARGKARPKGRLQFSLRTLLATTAIVAVWTAVVVFAANVRKAEHPNAAAYPVTGTVRRHRRPLQGALVVFIRVDGDESGPALGVSDASGRFALNRFDGSKSVAGALPGEYDVVIRPGVIAGDAQPPSRNIATLAAQAISDNKSFLFDGTVVAGAANDFAFELP